MRNSTKRLYRFVEHSNRCNKFSYAEMVLTPERVVNRALYGTDYDPKDVSFRIQCTPRGLVYYTRESIC